MFFALSAQIILLDPQMCGSLESAQFDQETRTFGPDSEGVYCPGIGACVLSPRAL